MNSRAQILELVRGQRGSAPPLFGCLSTVIAPALERRGLLFHEIHHNAQQMVTAAAAAYELYGWQSATLPTHLCVEADALGASVDYREDMPEAMWPLVGVPLFDSPEQVTIPQGAFAQRGRIPLVVEALRQLKARVGNEIVVGAFVPGPFTLAVQVIDFNVLLPAVRHSPRAVTRALDVLTDAIIATANAYQNAGADFVTIHEMGGSPGVLGPQAFGELVIPRLQKLIRAISAPTILSVCGNTNHAMELLVQAGAKALHVEHTNNLVRSRELVGKDVLLFGNLDPVHELAMGDEGKIRAGVERALQGGVDAVMPGCDLYLATPEENLLEVIRASARE